MSASQSPAPSGPPQPPATTNPEHESHTTRNRLGQLPALVFRRADRDVGRDGGPGRVLVLGVASYFRLSSETRALRNGLIQASGVKWQQKIAFNVGDLTLGVARAGLSLAHLDDQARAALQSVRGCEVGIYELAAAAETPDRAAMLKAADKAMSARGWERVVGVMDEHALITVYVPEKNPNPQRLDCRVMVFEGRQMVLVSAETKPQKLIECALRQPTTRAKVQWLAKAK